MFEAFVISRHGMVTWPYEERRIEGNTGRWFGGVLVCSPAFLDMATSFTNKDHR